MNLWMWRPTGHALGDLEQQMNRLLDLTLNMVGQQLLTPPQPYLACNIYETPTEYQVLMPLPGATVEGLELHAAGGNLMLKGQRHRPAEIPDEVYRRQERWMGRWTRSVPLPPRADVEGITASLENGLLLIKIPKQPEPTPQVLPIKVGRSHPVPAPRAAKVVDDGQERKGGRG
jgi:HSP20 family protein